MADMPPSITALAGTLAISTRLASWDDAKTEIGTGRNASPASMGENPCASCTNCPRKKNTPNIDA